MALVLGAQSTGKTTLLKRLSSCTARGSYTNLDETPSTIPTVGTNLVNITLSRKKEITLRELGGCMGPIWKNYFKDFSVLLYLVDMSNKTQVSSSCIQLLEVLTHDGVQHIPVLIVLNKMDMPGAMGRVEFDNLCQIGNIIKFAKQEITVLEASAKDGQGLQEIVGWIQKHCGG